MNTSTPSQRSTSDIATGLEAMVAAYVSHADVKHLEAIRGSADSIVERIGERALDAMAMERRRMESPKVRFYLGRHYTSTERMCVWDAMSIACDPRAMFTRIELRWSGDVRMNLSIETEPKGRYQWSKDEDDALALGMNPPGRTWTACESRRKTIARRAA